MDVRQHSYTLRTLNSEYKMKHMGEVQNTNMHCSGARRIDGHQCGGDGGSSRATDAR